MDYTEYELTVITPPKTAIPVFETLTNMAQASGFYAGKIEDEGVKLMPYLVENYERGRYLFMRLVTDDPEAPAALTRLLDDRRCVLRYLLAKASNNK